MLSEELLRKIAENYKHIQEEHERMASHAATIRYLAEMAVTDIQNKRAQTS